MRTVAESGECIIRRVRAGSSYKVPLRLQLLDSYYQTYAQSTPACGWKDTAGNYIDYYGVRINRQGERIGYWLWGWEHHPTEYASKSVLVDAKDIIHLYEVERPGQICGIPILVIRHAAPPRPR